MISFIIVLSHPDISLAQTPSNVFYPCSVVLKPVRDIPNAMGTALIAHVEKPYSDAPSSPVRKRQSIGIYADWLPSPSSLGDYDQYEGFAQIPDVISWRFQMYPVEQDVPSWFGGTPWAGKFDEITSELPEKTVVQVRLSNSETNKLGPVILQNTLNGCHN
ncbi:MAG TPA: hypothetical protein VFT51_01115 [Bacillales bacterium]|nr:hypothetical protein [Bacillales bacterium]